MIITRYITRNFKCGQLKKSAEERKKKFILKVELVLPKKLGSMWKIIANYWSFRKLLQFWGTNGQGKEDDHGAADWSDFLFSFLVFRCVAVRELQCCFTHFNAITLFFISNYFQNMCIYYIKKLCFWDI